MPRHVFFDLDGTLTDPFVGITASIRYALAELGETVPEPETRSPTRDDAVKDRAVNETRM